MPFINRQTGPAVWAAALWEPLVRMERESEWLRDKKTEFGVGVEGAATEQMKDSMVQRDGAESAYWLREWAIRGVRMFPTVNKEMFD